MKLILLFGEPNTGKSLWFTQRKKTIINYKHYDMKEKIKGAYLTNNKKIKENVELFLKYFEQYELEDFTLCLEYSITEDVIYTILNRFPKELITVFSKCLDIEVHIFETIEESRISIFSTIEKYFQNITNKIYFHNFLIDKDNKFNPIYTNLDYLEWKRQNHISDYFLFQETSTIVEEKRYSNNYSDCEWVPIHSINVSSYEEDFLNLLKNMNFSLGYFEGKLFEKEAKIEKEYTKHDYYSVIEYVLNFYNMAILYNLIKEKKNET